MIPKGLVQNKRITTEFLNWLKKFNKKYKGALLELSKV